jgi:hypothetical protein
VIDLLSFPRSALEVRRGAGPVSVVIGSLGFVYDWSTRTVHVRVVIRSGRCGQNFEIYGRDRPSDASKAERKRLEKARARARAKALRLVEAQASTRSEEAA